jgi:hypothetical protein
MTMLRRLLLSTLLALPMLAVAVPVAPAQPKVTTWSVYFRGKGRPDYHLFGHYVKKEYADTIARFLRDHDHFETQVRTSNTPIPKIPPRKPSELMPTNVTVSMTKAREMFSLMSRQKDIAFRYPIDGCYARAELMIERLRQQHKLHPYRVWSVANGEPLHAKSKNVKAGFVEWGYHVAPLLRVRIDAKKQSWYVIDPSLFQQPVAIDQWETAQMKTRSSHKPYIALTKVGEAPVWIDHKRKNGTGYWPASDPREGLHNHAAATMKKYKALEGKVSAPFDDPRQLVLLEARQAFGILRGRLALAAEGEGSLPSP